MAGLGIGGLGNVGNNFLEGYQQAQDIKFQQSQRQRVLDEQARQDQLRNDLRGVSQTEDVEVANPDYVENPVVKDDEGNDMPAMQAQPKTITQTRKRTEDAMMRDYANAYMKQGDIAKANEFNEKADKIAFLRTGRQVNEIMASPGTFMDKAKAASTAFNNDPFGGGIKGDPVQNPDGSITLNLIHKDNPGVVTPKTFANERELGEALQAHYSPDTYQKILETKLRIQEEMAKNPYQTVAPGATAIDKRTGKVVYNNPTDRVVTGYDADGNAIYGKPSGGTGTGAGTGAGKGGKAPLDAVGAALAHFDNATKDAEDKLTIDQRSAARDNVSKLATQNPNIPPAMASRIGIAIAKDPSKLVPAINPDTGLIDQVYDDGTNGKITFNAGVGSALKPGDLKPEQLQQMTATLLAGKSPQERAELVAAANDGKARAELEGRMRKQAQDAITQATEGMNPQQAQAVTDRINAALNQKLGYLGNNLDMIHSYGEKPKPQNQQQPGNQPRIAQPGGLYVPDPNSPAGRSQAKQAALRAEAQKAEQAKIEAQQALSSAFQRDKATMSPLELAQKYDSLRGKLPTGDAAELQRIERKI